MLTTEAVTVHRDYSQTWLGVAVVRASDGLVIDNY